MLYTVVSNASPGKTGVTEISQFDDEDVKHIPRDYRTSPYLVRNLQSNLTNTISTPPIYRPVTYVKPLVIENNIQNVVNASSSTISFYEDTAGMTNITSKSLIINNGLGLGTIEDIIPSIWNKNTSTINFELLKEIIEVKVGFTVSTDTLGGSFEIIVQNNNTNLILTKQEFTVNIQNQDYICNFVLISDSTLILEGASLYIKPEIGMKLNLNNIKLTFTKGIRL